MQQSQQQSRGQVLKCNHMHNRLKAQKCADCAAFEINSLIISYKWAAWLVVNLAKTLPLACLHAKSWHSVWLQANDHLAIAKRLFEYRRTVVQCLVTPCSDSYYIHSTDYKALLLGLSKLRIAIMKASCCDYEGFVLQTTSVVLPNWSRSRV